MIKRISISLTLLLFIFYSAHAGGGWVHQKGKGFFKLSGWWINAKNAYDRDGNSNAIGGTFSHFNVNLYGEYGLTDRLDVQVYFPFMSQSKHGDVAVSMDPTPSLLPGRSITSVGDADIGIKYGIIQNKPFVLSAHLILGIPLGQNEINTALGADQIPLSTGDGEFNQIIGLTGSTSKSFGSVNAYTSLGFEFNNRTNGYSDETRVNFELGAVIKNKFILAYKLRWLKSSRNGSEDYEFPASLFSNNTEYLAYTYELAYNVTDKIGVAFNYAAVYNAKLILAAPTYSVGTYFNL